MERKPNPNVPAGATAADKEFLLLPDSIWLEV